jgi:hypothetical protein
VARLLYGPDVYNLDHLHPCQIVYVQPPNGDKPERKFKVDVTYSMHCFTRGLKSGEVPESALLYNDAREKRVFDFRRQALSRNLPRIVERLPDHKCFHTGQGDFFTVNVLDESGKAVDYEVFFKAYKSAQKRELPLSLRVRTLEMTSTQGQPLKPSASTSFFTTH